MKAAQLTKYGDQDALRVVQDAPRPVANSDQVLVEVYAASVNPFDWKVRQGYMKDAIALNLPATLGGDVAGIVAEVGDNVTGFEIGQPVYGMANAVGGQGSFAEYTPVSASQLAAKPQSVDFVQAAALPLTAISAYQALVDHMNLQAGQKILIHGGAGGIGSLAIQIAKHIGAHVATTVKADDKDYVTQLGADVVIDYTAEDFAVSISDYDAVYDTVGGETNTKSFDVLKSGGVLVSMVAEADQERVTTSEIKYIHQSTKPTVERLAKISSLVDEGYLEVAVDKIFPLEEAAQALEYLKSAHTRGKVVIQVKT